VKKNNTLAIEQILYHCGNLQHDEILVILYDEMTQEVASLFVNYVKIKNIKCIAKEIPLQLVHGIEPPEDVLKYMLEADLILGMGYMSLAHTNARKLACKNGARFLSLPEYSKELLDSPSILIDYYKRGPVVHKVSDILTMGDFVNVKTSFGTDIDLLISGRYGNSCPGYVTHPGDLGSPPDIEANIAPVEGSANGLICVDGSIPCPQFGLLQDIIRLYVESGKIVNIESDNLKYKKDLTSILSNLNSPDAYNIAELGFGLNEKCKLTGNMLTDEGANGTVHFGLGSNITIGGKTDINFHLDCVIKSPTVAVDGVVIVAQGEVLV